MNIRSFIKESKQSPIRKNVFSTFLGLGIQLFTQLVLVPFYIVCWGNELYSDWIVLSAITGFFSVTDIGLTTVTVNYFSMEYANKNYNKCNSLLANSSMLLCSVFTICVIIVIPLLFAFNVKEVVGLHSMSRAEGTVVVLLFLGKIFFGMLGAVYNSIYRATSMASKGMMAVNVSKMLEGVFLVICLITKVPILVTAVLFVLPTYLLYVYIKYNTTKKIYQYSFSFRYLDKTLFKELIVPSFSFMAFPLCQSLNTQGMTLIINSFFGADIVVLFNTTRTLVNFVKSVIGNIQNAIWPEFTVAFANNDTPRIKRISRKTFQASFYSSLFIALVLCLTGSYIYEIWTRGKVCFDMPLMVIFMIIVVADSFWSSSRLILNATNNHIKIGPLYLVMTALAICLSYVVGRYTHNLYLCIAVLLIIDLVMAPFTLSKGLKLTNVKIHQLFRM